MAASGKVLGTVTSVVGEAKATAADGTVRVLQVGDTIRLFSGSKYDTTYAIRQLKYYSQKNKKQVVGAPKWTA